MAKLVFDKEGERLYETGVSECVLYVKNAGGYGNGVAWNGVTAINETPEGAEATALYADNIKYLNLISAEELNGTIEAYTYPDEFGACDGSENLGDIVGVTVGQQARKMFGLAFKTRLGNDVSGSDYGYKLHIIYGCIASPSERAYATINDSPEAITFSWEFSTTPVNVAGMKPTSLITIDSTKVNQTALQNLLDKLYGTDSSNPELPNPAEIAAFFNSETVTATYDLTHALPMVAPAVVAKGNTYNVSFVAVGSNDFESATPTIATGATVANVVKTNANKNISFDITSITANFTVVLTAG